MDTRASHTSFHTLGIFDGPASLLWNFYEPGTLRTLIGFAIRINKAAAGNKPAPEFAARRQPKCVRCAHSAYSHTCLSSEQQCREHYTCLGMVSGSLAGPAVLRTMRVARKSYGRGTRSSAKFRLSSHGQGTPVLFALIPASLLALGCVWKVGEALLKALQPCRCAWCGDPIEKHFEQRPC